MKNRNSTYSPIHFIQALSGKWTGELDVFAQGVQHTVKSIIESHQLPLEDSFTRKLIIAIADNDSLKNRQTLVDLYQTRIRVGENTFRLRKISSSETERIDNYSPFPILLMGTDDIMELNQEDGVGSSSMKAKVRDVIRFSLDSRYRFWDHSIWHRYVSIYPIDRFEKTLIDTLNDIITYQKNNLYNVYICNEHLEFQVRKAANSYFPNLQDGHHQKVTPYRFHSESVMKQKADKIAQSLTFGEHNDQNFQWGCIIIDDYFRKPLRVMADKEVNGNQSAPNKTEIIKELLNRDKREFIVLLNEKDEDKGGNYVSLAEHWLKKYPYTDVVLLDYLLGRNEPNPEEQYGHKLIAKIMDPQGDLLDQKPHDKHWIFPISVFDYSFQSHLRSMGYDQLAKYIEVSYGADPVNTPELFRYEFFSFIKTQFNELFVDVEGLIKELVPPFELTGTNSQDDYRSFLSEKFVLLSEKFASFNSYRRKSESSGGTNNKGSLLAKSLYHFFSGKQAIAGIIHHLQQLTYLIANRTNIDDEYIWKEYLLLRELVLTYNHTVKNNKFEISLDDLTHFKDFIINRRDDG